jgi:hypothetical protein
MSVLNIITKVLDDLTGIKYESLFHYHYRWQVQKKVRKKNIPPICKAEIAVHFREARGSNEQR